MRAVANSSVLIALSGIGRLSLLSQRFPQGILVPRAVWREVVETGKGRPGAEEVSSASWITTCEVTNRTLVSLLCAEIDEGEAEAIALAQGSQVRTVLLDEKDARRLAQRIGLDVLGTVGVLIWARRTGAIGSLKDELEALQTRGRFRLAESVCSAALRAAGEEE